MTIHDVLARDGSVVVDALRPSLSIRHAPDAAGRSQIGGSRMLGRPGEAWPYDQGRPMRLLAQIDFSECVDLVEDLPARGILQAFITCGDLPVMGEKDLDGGEARLRILPTEESLMWIESGQNLPGYAVRFEVVQTAPDLGIDGLTDEENDLLTDSYWAEGHRMLGHPCPVQYDLFDYPANFNPKGNRVLALQIDGDERLGWHWVDHGVLYFLADGEALRQGRIEDALFEMQFR